MTSKSAAEEMVLEFTASPEFQESLHVFVVGGTVRPGTVLSILKQFLDSPLGAKAHSDFWNAPSLRGPELDFEPGEATYPISVADAAPASPAEIREYNENWAKGQAWYKAPPGEDPEAGESQ